MQEFRIAGPIHLRRTLGALVVGPGDPTLRASARELTRATRTPEGPATLRVELVAEERARACAWGPGADWVLSRVPDLLGADDPPPELPPDAPRRLVALARCARDVRLPRTRRIVEMLVPIVLQQKVAGKEAARAYRNLVRAFSEPAPGPDTQLWLPLAPQTLRALPPAACVPLGVPPRHAETLCRVGWAARRLEEVDTATHAEAEARLRLVPGLGLWSARQALLRGMGGADAVPVGDYNLPAFVAWNLAGEERADDARMLELLDPYRGWRGWVLRWILAAGHAPPRRGARRPLRKLPGRAESH